MDLSIVIVNYQTYEVTRNAISSILKYSYPFSYEIIVVDNASRDDSLAHLKADFESRVKFIESGENKGFAGGNNLALRNLKSRYTLLLNSDTIVYEDTLTRVYDYMEENPSVGACGCQVLLENGQLDKASRRSFPNPQNAFYRLFHIPVKSEKDNYNLDELDNDGVYEIDCLTGAFMFIRHKALTEVGFLDETFFMYGEDIDLCYRIKKAGWKIVYFGKSKITHFKGLSSKKQKNKLIYEFYHSMYIYYNKHNRKDNPFYLNWLVYLGIAVLCVLKLVLNLFK